MPKRATPESRALDLKSVQSARETSKQFLDAGGLAQVKYEMLRRVYVDGVPVSQAVKAFGFSRQAFYKALAAFQENGLSGLIAKARGPKQGHKLTDEILDFLEQRCRQDPSLRPPQLTKIVQREFGVELNPSTIRKGILRRRANGRGRSRGGGNLGSGRFAVSHRETFVRQLDTSSAS